MSPFETAFVCEGYQQPCQDRLGVFEIAERVVIVVADGAGGIGSGDAAAEIVVHEVKHRLEEISTADDCSLLLSQVDHRIGLGESTAVVIAVAADGVYGASVGDSQAWLICDGRVDNLTINQHRKPLLGTGEARPSGFTRPPLDGLLIVASDGFGNYVKRDLLAKTILLVDFPELPRHLLEMVQLKSGELWDDTSVVVCRQRPTPKSSKRYNLPIV